MVRAKAAENLVVVGASAGGIEALAALVASLPADFPAPVVIAQHLDPRQPSHLDEILARHSSLPVRTVTDREALTPGVVFVVPANQHVEISDHMLRLHADHAGRSKPSVDLLLNTAAAVFGEGLIAVILTGSGSDGAAGARAVKAGGGTVIIQDPATAAFPSMPRSLAPTTVDIVAPLERIGPLLADLLSGLPAEAADAAAAPMQAVLDRVRERRGVDFTRYKPPTIARRLRRRMAAVGTATIDDYLGHLDGHPEEEERLLSAFLIKVTEFFRDPALFDHLRQQVLPELVAATRQHGRELRLWSAGCATGEEAYSLAILVADLLGPADEEVDVRIFATDLDAAAVAFARHGVYPASALENLPPELVARHFTPRDGAYEISKCVRGLVIFGHHDLGQRPPFPHTDLILCRNVLIYFTPELQERALHLFAYSLREGGYLVLGKSETPGPLAELFAGADRRLRIFRRQGARLPLPPTQLPPPLRLPRRPGELAPRGHQSLELALKEAQDATRQAQSVGAHSDDLVRTLPIGVVVVDRRYDIQAINTVARELLGIYNLGLGEDFIHLAQRIPSSPLRAAIDAVGRGEASAILDEVVTTETATGETRYLTLACHPRRPRADGTVETILVLVTDGTTAVQARQAGARETARLADERDRLQADAARWQAERAELAAAVDRLAEANRHLLTANRELTDVGDDLRARNDEMLLATAGVQVAAEEIETLNEEMQSTNEELETLNEEMHSTNEELHAANDDLIARSQELQDLADRHAAEQARLTAILVSMGDAVLVVAEDGRSIRTNAAYDELLGDGTFVPEDVHGRPLPPAATPRLRAARGESFRMDFTTTADGARRWFEATGRPLRGDDAGGVLVIRDVTDRSLHRLQEQFLSLASHELRTPLTALQGYLQLAQRQLRPGGDPDRVGRYLDGSLQQARRQELLIGDLLDVARLQSGKLTMNRAPLDLVPLAAGAVETARVLGQDQAIALEAAAGPLLVDGDARRLEQALLNLLTNAITYAPGADPIEVRLWQDDGAAEIQVRDFGRGIAADDLARIFTRFAQVERGDGAARGGLGLGLFIAREIVQAHDGSIAVQSTVGEGTTFTIRLPLRDQTDGGPTAHPSGSAS